MDGRTEYGTKRFVDENVIWIKRSFVKEVDFEARLGKERCKDFQAVGLGRGQKLGRMPLVWNVAHREYRKKLM